MAKDKQRQAAAAKRHYEANKETVKARAREYTKQHRKRIRDYVNKAKAKPCTDCGVEYPPRVMEFDHCRGDKRSDLSQMYKLSVSLETVQLEIDKCDLVCANCHRLRHIERD